MGFPGTGAQRTRGRGGADVPQPLLLLNTGLPVSQALHVTRPVLGGSGKCRDLGTWQGAVGLGQMKRGRCWASVLQELGCTQWGDIIRAM